ncbi:hypothetical protein [Saccharothrix syringae]|uniref:Uncharacterized protein n=1 Tax=Saccharothrix syringae TaxID=103733 RepID=A0A5Q0H0I0_SACSY|nr:hypothetical protein [Saccharothrix syringae]QFZ19623.1 hypothetical protein EKG83_21265 [Saccharothrix syringae]
MHRRPPPDHRTTGCHCPPDTGPPGRPGLSVVVGLALAGHTATALAAGAAVAALLSLALPLTAPPDLPGDLATDDVSAALATGAALVTLLVTTCLRARCRPAGGRHRTRAGRVPAVHLEGRFHLRAGDRLDEDERR